MGQRVLSAALTVRSRRIVVALSHVCHHLGALLLFPDATMDGGGFLEADSAG